MSVLKPQENNISKPIQLSSLKSENLKSTQSASVPTKSFPLPDVNVWEVRKNKYGKEWEQKFNNRSNDIAKCESKKESIQREWNPKCDFVARENFLRTEISRMVPLLTDAIGGKASNEIATNGDDNWYTQFEEPSDDENDDDMYISAIGRQNIEDQLKWESQYRHLITGGFTTAFEQGINYSRLASFRSYLKK
jgi:hypothetical protein